MTLILKLDLVMVKMYLHTKNEVSMSSSSKVIAWTDSNTDTQTHRHTDRHDQKHYLPAYAGGKDWQLSIMVPFSFAFLGTGSHDSPVNICSQFNYRFVANLDLHHDISRLIFLVSVSHLWKWDLKPWLLIWCLFYHIMKFTGFNKSDNRKN